MWLLIGITLILALAALLLFRPKQQEPPDPAKDEISVPKVQEGDELGRIYGCYWLTDPQAAWAGDEHIEPITKSPGKK